MKKEAGRHSLRVLKALCCMLLQMIFRTSAKTQKARHFRRMYDKKVNVLGLSAVMGLPDTALPSEVQAGLPQLMGGALTLLSRLRDQEVPPTPLPFPPVERVSHDIPFLYPGSLPSHCICMLQSAPSSQGQTVAVCMNNLPCAVWLSTTSPGFETKNRTLTRQMIHQSLSLTSRVIFFPSHCFTLLPFGPFYKNSCFWQKHAEAIVSL